MNQEHLSEELLQIYAMDKSGCSPAQLDHAVTCSVCQERAALYALLFKEVKGLPKPAFDFDLSELVLTQLPQSRNGFQFNTTLFYVLAICAIAIPCWLFKSYLLQLFSGIMPITISMLVMAVVLIFLFQGIEVYRKYQKLLDAVN